MLIKVFIPGIGYVARSFRSEGEYIAYMKNKYGNSYKRLKPKLQRVFDKRTYVESEEEISIFEE